PAPDARRFQSGTPPIPLTYAAEAGLDVICEYGIDAIGMRNRELSGLCLDELRNLGIAVATPRHDDQRGSLVAIRSSDAPDLVARLAQQNVVVTSRDGNIRAGFHFYNDEVDVARFLAALETHRSLLLPA
ncbi:MAG: aminotransferase class V-fold PLP-dependent enzyme, partial [Alphaproteobacteria bacterium]|nr:aminotransferase class V-fold PLP-dependent enzyme [Alphaproteobacteria bacterium]